MPLPSHDPRSVAQAPRREGQTPPAASCAGGGEDCAKTQAAAEPQALPPRLGPRPLAVHLLQARRAAVSGEEPGLLEDFLCGVRRYWAHPYRRRQALCPVLWSSGPARLLDHGPPDGWPVLVVPSLINRAYILDLMPGRSLVRHLAGHGLRPLLLEWGEPGPAERRMPLDDHIVQHLGGALAALQAEGLPRPVVLGYCMGGLLAVALATLHRERIAGVALLAVPWDFHASDPALARAIGQGPAPWLGDALGGLPVDVLQLLFAALDPLQVPRKFARFARRDPTSAEAVAFVAVEDWLNDGVALGGEVARACLAGWGGANQPARGAWRVAGRPIRPEALKLPALVAIPERDRIVPPASAAALAESLPDATVLRPRGGHIAMIVGAAAERDLWRPLAAWLRQVAAMQE
jgi:polyhydroxyalkanoate synthase subunit PhaC